MFSRRKVNTGLIFLVVEIPASTEHLGVLKNSLKRVPAFQMELEFESVGFKGKGKTKVPGEKPPGTRERTNNKLNPHMTSTQGFEPAGHIAGTSA